MSRTTMADPQPRRPQHSRIRLPNLHLRLTPPLSDRGSIASAVRRFPGGPPVRPA